MSVLFEMSMFPLDTSESKSKEVKKVVKVIQKSGFENETNAMGTTIETNSIDEALELIKQCFKALEHSNRIYASVKFDIRKDHQNCIKNKLKSLTSP